MLRSLALCCVLAVSAAAAAERALELRVSAEVRLGGAELGPTVQFSTRRPAIASDGVELFVVYQNDRGGVFAQRLRADGTPLTELPVVLVASGAGNIISAQWVGDAYAVVLAPRESTPLRVLLFSRDGAPLGERTLTEPLLAREIAWNFDEFAALGEESISTVRRDGTVQATLPLPRVTAGADRAVTFNRGRYAILTAERSGVTVRFYNGRQVSEPIVLAPALRDFQSRNDAAIIWSGSEYVAVWNDCGAQPPCLTEMARLAWNGTLLAPPQSLGRFTELDLTAIGDNTVLLTYDYSDRGATRAAGRRYRAGVLLDEERLELGDFEAEGFHTAGGETVTVDRSLLFAAIPAGGRPSQPLARIARSAAWELAVTAAASETELVVVRNHLRGGSSYEVSVVDADGHITREFPLGDALYWQSLASDGREVFRLERDSPARLVRFGRVAPDAPMKTLALGGAALDAFVWNGAAFVTLWVQPLRTELVDREGAPLGRCELPPLNASDLQLVRSGDETWLAFDAGLDKLLLQQLDARGCASGPALVSTHSSETIYGVSAAANGGTIGMLYRDFNDRRQHPIRFAYRPPGGSIVLSPTIFPQELHHYASTSILSAIGERHFIILTATYRAMVATLIDLEGHIESSVTLAGDTSGPATVVRFGRDRVAVVYARPYDEPPFFGLDRVTVKMLTIVE
ncbi:MAG TPA: hypothetical protein VF824_19050 [Thermoanaerobaculia bacterium]|jgi:hypothetical protein